MKETIINLMRCYKEFLLNISEYNILTESIKSRMSTNKTLVQYYSLEKKNCNYSTYDNRVVTYLIENNLDKFYEKQISDKKIKSLIDSNILTEDAMNYFIEREKTVLLINSSSIPSEIASHKASTRSTIDKMEMIELIRKRELLKLQINDLRNKYYNAAKSTKDMLLLHCKDKITVKIKDEVVKLEIKLVKTIYKKELIQYLELNNIDAFEYKANIDKLKNSKSKKLNREIIDRYKIENTKECLYIHILQGLLKKYNKSKLKEI